MMMTITADDDNDDRDNDIDDNCDSESNQSDNNQQIASWQGILILVEMLSFQIW